MTAAPPPPNLDVAIIACNNERTIERTVASVAGLARRVVVIDSGSTDRTIDLCRGHGAEVVHHPWEGYGRQKQRALDACDATWVLSLDSDESPDTALLASVRRAVAADDPAVAGYAVNRRVWIGDVELAHTWHPEWLVRLVRRDRARWIGDYHERLEVDGATARLPGLLRHDAVADVGELVRKQAAHGVRAAEVYYGEGRRGGVGALAISPAAAVLKQLLRGAWRDGWMGWVAAYASGVSAAAKHMRLLELTRATPPAAGPTMDATPPAGAGVPEASARDDGAHRPDSPARVGTDRAAR